MTRPLPRLVSIALAAGVIALALSLARLAWSPAAFFRSYLPACLFWIGIPVGSLALLMIHRLTGGGWGDFARQALTAGAGVLPLNALLFIPLAFGLPEIYPWAAADWHPEGVTGGQAIWLRPGFFLAREAAVLVLWLGLAAPVWSPRLAGAGRGSRRKEAEPRPSPRSASPPDSLFKGGEARSALGLIVYGLTVTVFAIDWIMSLEPRWSSTNIGFQAAVGPMLSALAFATAVLCLQARNRALELSAPRFADLGGLLLAFVLLWSYLTFQEYLTVWSENLPNRILWYVQRNHAGWRGWSWIMAAVYGALPFFLLLSRALKRDPRRLIRAAGLVLAGSLLYAYWEVLPSFYPTPSALSPLDLLPFIGIGGLWIAAYLWILPRCPAGPGTREPHHG